MAKAAAFLFVSLLFFLSISDQSRLDPDTYSNSNLISDGICHETWMQSYGILPCSTTFWGDLFIVLLYGCLTFISSKLISSGSELLFKNLGSGFDGGVFLPIVDALPVAIPILVSGLSGSKETAQKQVQIGMGLLAGSTVMRLTLLWGSCVVVGKCDLVNPNSLDSQDNKRCSLTGSGVTTDAPTSHASKIMIISVIPFIVVQLPKVFHISSGSRIAVLISLILAVAFLISHRVYQFQERRAAGSHYEIAEGVETRTWVFMKAGLMLLLGTLIAVKFADPLVESVTDFSNATNIPSFFISFIAMPLATNFREAVSAIIIASKKKQQTTSLTFSQIYGEVTTNNLTCLAVFLALVYVRHLTWDFSAEVLVILIVCIVMGLFTSFSTTYPLWTCSIAFFLYALSLVLIYVLKWP